jgi:ATP-dependent Clp protease, protease subunit
VRQEAATGEATIYLYDVIDAFWGVSASQFVKDLNAITAPVIHLRINSPGGDVFDGRAIATAIRQHKSKVIAHVDGLAASAASYVAIAATEVEMAPGSFLMIHNAWTIAAGNCEDFLATAAILEKIDQSLVEDYAKCTGCDPEQVKAWMCAETWFTAQEAIDNGFADRMAADPMDPNDPGEGDEPNDPMDPNEPTEARWDMKAFGERAIAALERAGFKVTPPAAQNKGTEADVSDDDAEHDERVRRLHMIELNLA